MRSSRNLATINDVVARRIGRILSLLKSKPDGGAASRNLVVTWSAIELDNLIINLQREFLVSCLIGCCTSQGQPVTHTVSVLTEQDAVHYIMKILEPGKYKKHVGSHINRRDETVLRDPSRLLQVATAAKLSNNNEIANAISLNLNVFDELKSARHFFAHRNRDTAAAFRALAVKRSLPIPVHEWMVIDQLLPQRPYTLLDEWLGEISQFHGMLTR